MPYRRTRRTHHSTRPVTVVKKPSLMDRLTGRRTRVASTTRTTRHTHHHHHAPVVAAAPVHHQRRKPRLTDKISGALMRLRGSLTRRPGLKAAGTRRQRGTDGRGSRRRAYY